MSRPTKFEDLSIYTQQGPKVASFDHAYFLSLPRKTLIRTLKTIESMDKDAADGLLDREGFVYRLRPTEKDRERKLRAAQSEWDRTKKYYEDPASAPDWMHWDINRWAEEEGKPTIDWPEEN